MPQATVTGVPRSSSPRAKAWRSKLSSVASNASDAATAPRISRTASGGTRSGRPKPWRSAARRTAAEPTARRAAGRRASARVASSERRAYVRSRGIQNPTGEMATAEATAPRRASSSAIPPPVDTPATCGRPRPSSAKKDARRPA